MKYSPVLFLTAAILAAGATTLTAQDKAVKEVAQKKHDAAASEPDNSVATQMLCDAAAMVPKNAEFAGDCNQARTTLINRDKKYLLTAEDAKKSDPDKAKRYAGFILKVDPKIDPDTYAKAQQFLKELSSPATPAVVAQTPTAPTPKDQSGTFYTQALGDFKAGNLQGAKAAAQQVTDPSLKSLANDLVAEIDKYSGDVAEGQRQESAGHLDQAVSAYQAAQNLNRNVAADNLGSKIEHLQTQIASQKITPTSPSTPGTSGGSKTTEVARTPANGAKPPETSPEDKKKALMLVYAQAMKNKELESAERALRQVVQLDPRDGGVKAQLDDLQKQITDALSRDPEKLEKTLRDAIQAFYSSDFEGAESKLNNYLRSNGAKKKGAAYFYLGATEETQALLESQSKRGSRLTDARDNFRQARQAGYQPVSKYVSEKILQAWSQAGA